MTKIDTVHIKKPVTIFMALLAFVIQNDFIIVIGRHYIQTQFSNFLGPHNISS